MRIVTPQKLHPAQDHQKHTSKVKHETNTEIFTHRRIAVTLGPWHYHKHAHHIHCPSRSTQPCKQTTLCCTHNGGPRKFPRTHFHKVGCSSSVTWGPHVHMKSVHFSLWQYCSRARSASLLTLSLPSSKRTFSQPLRRKCIKWCSENW